MRFRLSVILLAVLLSGAGCKSESGATAASPGPASGPKEVTLVPASEQLFGETVVGTGTLAADEEATLAFKVAGRVTAISVDLGTFVRKGDPVARLETTDFELKIAQAEAGLQQARARLGLDPKGGGTGVNVETTGTVRQARAVLEESRASRARIVALAEKGVVSRAEVDRVEADYRVAEAKYQDAIEEVRNRQAVLLQRSSEIAIARQQLSDSVLRAPFDGAIAERIAASGDYMSAGSPVAKLVRISPLRLRAEVPDRDAAGVRPGQAVEVTVDGVGAATGHVARVSPVINDKNRVLIVEIEVENSRMAFRPGGFARAKIGTDLSATAIVVPESALVSFAGIEKAFVVQDGKAVEKLVTTGRRESGRVEITNGLQATDMVVDQPGSLAAGQPVVVR